jgi:hypothetical protein
MVYERMRRDPAAELRLIADALQLNVPEPGIEATIRHIESLGHDDSSDAEFNPANLLHKKHIMDGRVGYHAETLPAALLGTVIQRYQEWLRSNGYVTA